jgi:hypothetical protein
VSKRNRGLYFSAGKKKAVYAVPEVAVGISGRGAPPLTSDWEGAPPSHRVCRWKNFEADDCLFLSADIEGTLLQDSMSRMTIYSFFDVFCFCASADFRRTADFFSAASISLSDRFFNSSHASTDRISSL